MSKDIKVLYSVNDINKRISELADQINLDYKGEELTVVGVLKGSFLFMADLVRKLEMPLRCDFLRVSSYQDDESTGVVRIQFDLSQPVKDKNVLLVEDIVDTGKTLEYLLSHLGQQHPKSMKVCSLLHKEEMGADGSKIDYLGFKVPSKFVVGYGLDSMGLYRSLPYIGYFGE